MIKKEDVYKIGTINKTHGVNGELQFTFTDDVFDTVDLGYIICLMDGIFVPFFFEEYRFRGQQSAIIKLEGIDSSEQAKRMTNTEVFFPKEYVSDRSDVSLSFFVGFSAVCNGKMIGEIVDIDDSTINNLFVVKSQGTDDIVLIPIQSEFIVEIDEKKNLIVLNLPDGLIDLNN